MCTLSSRHRWASFPKTLLDYDFLRWLGSALNITVRIGVASLPQHWSLLTRIHFGQRIFKCFHFFIFCASDWSQFWYGREKDLTQRDFPLKLDPTQPHIALHWETPTSQLPQATRWSKRAKVDSHLVKMLQDDFGWPHAYNPKCLNSTLTSRRLLQQTWLTLYGFPDSINEICISIPPCKTN